MFGGSEGAESTLITTPLRRLRCVGVLVMTAVTRGCARSRAHRRGPAMRETRVDGSLGCGCPVLEFLIFINLNLAVVFPADAMKRDAGR